jgi:Flp pilus assembly protein protease CpaA
LLKFSGLDQLPVFAVWLGLIGVGVYLLVVISRRIDVTLMLTRLGLRGIEETGKVPYGVPLALATAAAFIARMRPEIVGLG